MTRPDYDKNVSKNWKPVESLTTRKGFDWSDWTWHILVMLGGLTMIAVGVVLIGFLRRAKIGGAIAAAGFFVFWFGWPSDEARKGYRSS